MIAYGQSLLQCLFLQDDHLLNPSKTTKIAFGTFWYSIWDINKYLLIAGSIMNLFLLKYTQCPVECNEALS